MAFVFAFLVIGSVAFLSFLIFTSGAKKTGLWAKKNSVVVGDSPYRRAEAAEEVLQSAPIWLRIACWIAGMGGLVTLALLAPGGMILVLVALEQGSDAAPFVVLAVSLSGFPAGVMLIRVALRVLRRQAVRESTFWYLFTHHACVAAAMFFVQVSTHSLQVFPFSLAACSILFTVVAVMKLAKEVLPNRAPSRPRRAGVAQKLP